MLHGNNKSADELARALAAGVGRIVVDSVDELDRIEAARGRRGPPRPRCCCASRRASRPTPTSSSAPARSTRSSASAWPPGAAEAALARAAASPHVELVGIHVHIGSQVFVADFFHQAVEVLAPFVYRFGLPELVVGGGLGVAYVEGEEAPTITEWGRSVRDACADGGHHGPASAPSRAGPSSPAAAITLYTVGTVKDLPGIRTYVAVDGGMSDNPRPVLYGSGYETFLPRAVAGRARPRTVTVVGKHCESGDLLVRDGAGARPTWRSATCSPRPVTGAYGHSMGCNYNKVPRPPVVFCRDGDARLVVRRETDDDLLATDLG